MSDPILKFKLWWGEAFTNSPLYLKSAVCLATVTKEGFPAARYVDLKAADETGFTFCTQLDSKKGEEILANPKVALTVWWDHVGYQVRITGFAHQLSEREANEHWNARTREAQIATISSNQSQPLENEDELYFKMESLKADYRDKKIPKPEIWGGFKVKPIRIEFLTFLENRLHIRELYVLNENGDWDITRLQP